MSLRITNILVVALMMLAVNFAFCAALIRARSHYAAVPSYLENEYETHETHGR